MIDPFAITLTGTGHDETLGYVAYFERMDMRPGKGQAIQGVGRLKYDASMETRCIPSFHTMFFTTFPTEIWEPLPVGNYNVAAPALIKGGLAGFDGAYGEAYRTVTFVEGKLDKGI
ncbi:hypothetical protein RZS08_58450, partial [Arthrospira platensis SPKY1]|nr:hypothetical protein [Arthrospira platensis SPKY1]